MKLEKYNIVASDQYRSFEFLSEGPHGTIKKVVYFQKYDEDVYNLAFGDWDELKQTGPYQIVSEWYCPTFGRNNHFVHYQRLI